MHIRFDDRVALVTGAAQGIGRAIAAALAQAGARVHLADLDAEGVAASAGALGASAHVADLGSPEATKELVDAILKAEGRLDLLVNAAGGVRGQVGRPIEEISENDWRAVFAANVDAAFFLSQAAAPAMKQAGYGRIVNISSGAGLCQCQACAGRADQAARLGVRPARHHRELGRARLRPLQPGDRAAMGILWSGRPEAAYRRHPHAPARHTAGHRPCQPVLPVGAGRLGDRADPLCRWRPLLR
jgi:NAD(P)-dependent dehydrogenase (short-subunit alcohol dehydrogenase family)